MPQFGANDYTVALICPLAIELSAARLMLDESHQTPTLNIEDDDNQYTCGHINGHNVVIASLPYKQTGVVHASHLINPLTHSFPKIKVTLLVGIGGGIPHKEPRENPNQDIHLGDVVVGWPGPEQPAVVQWDSGTRLPEGRTTRISSFAPPDRRILNTLTKFHSDLILGLTGLAKHLQRCTRNDRVGSTFTSPGPANDILYEATYHHPHGRPKCESCDPSRRVSRGKRTTAEFQLHFGTIASGSAVVKDPELRDRMRDEEKAICFEMEAAGILGRQNCLVIRGIADYADSHKNDSWQPYAAATAAAVARELLYVMDPGVIKEVSPAIPPPNPNFVVRKDLLSRMNLFLENDDHRQVRFALVGLGGAGKTQLALHLAHEDRSQRHIFWLNASSYEQLMSDYSKIGKKVGVVSELVRQREACLATKAWLDSDKSGAWRIFIDTIDNIEDTFVQDINCILPNPNRAGALIFTSQNKFIVGSTLVPAGHGILVGMMDTSEATALFNKLAAEYQSSTEALNQLFVCLEHLPLAIEQAATYISRIGVTVTDYLEEFQRDYENRKTLWEYTPSVSTIAGMLPSKSVLSTWAVTFRKILRESSRAALLLQVMSFFDCRDIPAELLLGGSSLKLETTLHLKNVMAHLMQFGFVSSTDTGEGTMYHIHSLVSFCANTWARQSDDCGLTAVEIGLSLLADLLSKTWNDDFQLRLGSYTPRKKILKHADHLLQALVEGKPQLSGKFSPKMKATEMSIRYETAKTHFLAGQFRLTLQYLDVCRTYYDAKPALFSKELLQTRMALGMVNKELSQWKISLEWFDLSLQQAQDLGAASSVSPLDIYVAKAKVFREMGDFAEATRLYTLVRKKKQEENLTADEEWLLLLSCQGSMFTEQGNYQAARTNLKTALAEWETKSLGKSDQRWLYTLASLAEIDAEEGKFESAIDKLTEAIDGTTKNLGSHHPKTLLMRVTMGAVLISKAGYEIDDYEDGLNQLRAAYALQLEVLGRDHNSTLNTNHLIAVTLSRQEKFKEALAIFDNILNQRKNSSHEDGYSLEYYATLHSKADVLVELMRYDEASAAYQEAREGSEKVCGDSHLLRFRIRLGEANLLIIRGETRQGIEIISDLWRKAHAKFGDSFPMTKDLLQCLNDAKTECARSEKKRRFCTLRWPF